MFDRALKVVRQYHRLGQSELADKIGISRSYLNEIEKGKKEPSIDVLRRYSEYFNVPMSSLMLFAENSDGSSAGTVREFAADKVLRMLEWLSEGIDDEDATRTRAAKEKNTARAVPPVSAPLTARTRASAKDSSGEARKVGGRKQIRRIQA